jgi:uncharacterized membrane protein YidH (DUF202 family)
MAVKNRLAAEGRLICHQGNIQGYAMAGDEVEVTYRPRGTTETKQFRVRQVLSCTGPQSDYRKLNDVLVQRLLARDLLAPDPLRMGANTAEGGRIRNQAGDVIEGLYTLGSTQKGRLYESIAVPELRGQAASLAQRLLANAPRDSGNTPVIARPVIPDYAEDPQVYMAAERTFLAWIRTGLAFMGFGFVVARFGFFLREFGFNNSAATARNSFSIPLGLALIVAGIVINLYATRRHKHYIHALDQGRFRPAYSIVFTFFITGFLTLIGLAATAYVSISW